MNYCTRYISYQPTGNVTNQLNLITNFQHTFHLYMDISGLDLTMKRFKTYLCLSWIKYFDQIFFFEFCKILSISCWHNFRQQYSTQDLNISHTIFLALYRILCIINLEKGKIDSLSLNFKATFKHWNFFPTYH